MPARGGTAWGHLFSRVNGEDDETGAEGGEAAVLLRAVAIAVPSH